ncbi:MAG: 50S ribosomal protein L10 [Flavobacteriaceae bacterium]|nr:50S ribosomal protein L10 [Flavobacteriaceae bacterium]MCY4267584.1 50S ribosomal protein L10 [Flavobacteriaceae bacterium]
MTRAEKKETIQELTQILDSSEVLYVADLEGLTANKNNSFRRLCFENDVSLKVVKNTLLSRAMDSSTKDFGELDQVLKGSSTIIYGSQANQPAKLIRTFQKKENKPKFKGAYVYQSIYLGEDKLVELEKLKSKEELLSDVLGLLQAPAINVISALKSGGQNLMGILETISKKEKSN